MLPSGAGVLPPWPSIAQSPCGEFRTATLRTLARTSSPGVCHVQGPDAATCTLCPAGTSSLEKPRVTHHLPSQVAAAPQLPAKEPTISHPARAGRWPRRCGSPLPQRPQTTQAQRLRLLKHPPSSLAPSTQARPSLAPNSTVSCCPLRGPNSLSQESQAPTRHGPPFLRPSHFLPPARAMLNFAFSFSRAPSLCTLPPAPSNPSAAPL